MHPKRVSRRLTALVFVTAFVATAGASPAAGTATGLDSARWRIVPSPSPGTTAEVNAVSALSATDAWAVGAYGSPSRSRTLTLHWDGTRWWHVPSPSPDAQAGLDAVVALSSDDVWAVGSSTGDIMNGDTALIEHWDGTAWTVVPSPSPDKWDDLYGVMAAGPDRVWAVGQSDVFAARSRTIIEEWNGSAWRLVPSPDPGFDSFLYAGAAVSGTDAWAVGGNDGKQRANQQPLTEHWDGTRWSVVPNPRLRGNRDFESSFMGVAAVSTSDAWAVGYTGPHDAIEHWDGRAWRHVRSPDVALNATAAESSTSVWAAGSVYVGGRVMSFTEHWNGRRWSAVSSPQPPGESFLQGLASVPGTNEMWAVGTSTTDRMHWTTLIELYS